MIFLTGTETNAMRRVNTKRRRRDLISFLFGASDSVYRSHVARAIVGALLDVAESKPGPGRAKAKSMSTAYQPSERRSVSST
jgi:hypothetical protein